MPSRNLLWEGKTKMEERKKKEIIKPKNNRQAVIKVWMRESRWRRLQLDGGSALACGGKIKRTGGVLFSQRSLAAGSTPLLLLPQNLCVRVSECVIYVFA